MAKVRATARGYVGGVIRENGEVFEWPAGNKVGSWVEPVAFGGKGDHDGDGLTGGSLPSDPAGAVTVAADWRSGSAADRKALAKQITGENVPNAKEADEIIEAHLAASGPGVFGDAPAPETAGPVRASNEINDALGSTQPDWIDPGAAPAAGVIGRDKPVKADD